jgi:hypothetical protein
LFKKYLSSFQEPENRKLTINAAKIVSMAVIGLMISNAFVVSGAEMMIESGIPLETIKATIGPFYLTAGMCMSAYFIIIPSIRLFQLIMSHSEKKTQKNI